MSKFGNLSASVDETFKVVLIDPITDQPITTGEDPPRQAYIEVLSADSDVGRSFDREQRSATMRRAGRGRLQADDDGLEQNIAKLALLTRSWLLVDPVTREPIDVPCTPDNARELYSQGGTAYIFRQVFVEATAPANFIKRSSTTS
jgi:hypothetical protein